MAASRHRGVPQLEALGSRGMRVLGEVSAVLAAGLETDEALSRVAGILRRGLGLSGCRIWVRTEDGASFRAVVPPGEEPPGAGESAEIEASLADRREGAAGDGGALRFALRYEGSGLGVLELLGSTEGLDGEVAGTGRIVANILSPLLAATQLSQDLAGEVALRTREIEAQRRFTTKIIDSLPLGLYVVDRQYRIQAWNREREAGTQGVGREEALGRSVFEVLHRQPRELLKEEFDRVFATGKIEQVEVRSESSGEPRYYRITKVPMRLDDTEVTHVITIGEDITETKTAQQQISQMEKLGAVGQLAAGVMHEINNPLATIGACVEALQSRKEELPPPLRRGFEEYLRIIESELERCKSIVDGLLDFSRPKARLKKRVVVNHAVESALFLVRHHDRFKSIRVVRKLQEDIPDVLANEEQLIQAFLAIMLNAVDAMEGGGTLTVSSAAVPGGSGAQAGEVVVEISDTGSGIAPADLAKIFEPFFTTKEPGRGTGLGLSICYRIIVEHGGRILVDSQVGKGSTFRVFLPVMPEGEG
ncbi:Sensor kinase CckA [bacterium HR33]|nr:Sensor kinase CckA [bacterium HR33]